MEKLTEGYGLVEGPVWDPDRGLLFSDVLLGGVYCLNPDGDDDAGGEYIELYNNGQSPADLSAWAFTDGVTFSFQDGAVLEAGGYLVVASSSAHVAEAYGIANGAKPNRFWCYPRSPDGGRDRI